PCLTGEYAGKFAALKVSFTDGEGLTSSDFIVLCEAEKRAALPARKAQLKTENLAYVMQGENVTLTVDKVTGNLLSVKSGEKEYLAAPMRVSVTRAPTDNERNVRREYEARGVFDALPRVRGNAEEKDGALVLQGKAAPDCRSAVMDYTLAYAVTDEGFSVRLTYKFGDKVNRLPSVGLRFAVKKSDKKTEYFGYGPQETYRDTFAAAAKDVYAFKAKDGYHHYIKPQESGNHTQTERVSLPDMNIVAAEPFDFSAIAYSENQLTEKTHDSELRPSKKTYVFIGATEGVGSNSCGPALAEEYRVGKSGEFVFDFKLT
ncbi:MAG: hypothetical protein ACI4RO_05145, partial [Candidatus Scatosoma sp.]